MRIVGVMSSPSRNGNTATLVREALKAAQNQGAEVEEIFLAEHDLRFCQGCFQCMATGKCPLPDNLETLKEKVFSADGIIMGSPTYGLEPNGIMKNFLDRIGMYSAYTSCMADKYVIGISTAGAVGAKKVAKKLTGVVNGIFESGYVSGTLGVAVGWDSVTNQPKALSEVRALAIKLTRDIRSHRRYPFQNLIGRIIGRLVVQRAIKKNVLDHKDGTMKAVYEVLHEKGRV